MKKLGAIIFGIVLILGLSIEATSAQQLEIVNPDGVVSWGWSPTPTAGIEGDEGRIDDWGPDADSSYVTADDWDYSLTVDFADPTGGPYTAIRVKLRASTGYFGGVLSVGINAGGDEIGYFDVTPGSGFQEYSHELTGLNMTAAELADLQVEIMVTYFAGYELSISAVQVELVPEVAAPPPEEPDPIHVTIDYRPYRSSNPLNYRSRGKVRVVIFGSANVDVRQIDRESVLLAGVAPVRDHVRKVYSRTDRARDEHEDLVLMFKAQQLIKALEESSGEELKNGDPVDLELTGNLIKDDGVTPIEGEDTAVVFGKRHKHKKNGKWKNHWKWWR
jgi:hypothetical protein